MKLQRCYLYLRMHSMGRRLSTAHLFFYFFFFGTCTNAQPGSVGAGGSGSGMEKGQLISSSHNDGSVNSFPFF